jgi:hypothetical protein
MCKAIKAKKEANKHNNSTRGKEHEGRSNEEGDTGFGLEFTLTLQMWISSKQQNFLAATLDPNGSKLASQVDRYLHFSVLGVKSGP